MVYELIIRPIEPWLSDLPGSGLSFRTAPSTRAVRAGITNAGQVVAMPAPIVRPSLRPRGCWTRTGRGLNRTTGRGLLARCRSGVRGDDPRLTAVQHVAVAHAASDACADPPSRLSAPSVHRPGGSPDFGAVFRLRTLTADWPQRHGEPVTGSRLVEYRFIHIGDARHRRCAVPELSR